MTDFGPSGQNENLSNEYSTSPKTITESSTHIKASLTHILDDTFFEENDKSNNKKKQQINNLKFNLKLKDETEVSDNSFLVKNHDEKVDNVEEQNVQEVEEANKKHEVSDDTNKNHNSEVHVQNEQEIEISLHNEKIVTARNFKKCDINDNIQKVSCGKKISKNIEPIKINETEKEIAKHDENPNLQSPVIKSASFSSLSSITSNSSKVTEVEKPLQTDFSPNITSTEASITFSSDTPSPSQTIENSINNIKPKTKTNNTTSPESKKFSETSELRKLCSHLQHTLESQLKEREKIQKKNEDLQQQIRQKNKIIQQKNSTIINQNEIKVKVHIFHHFQIQSFVYTILTEIIIKI